MSHNPVGPIVVGVDGSEAALGAVGWAAAEARLRRLPLRLVHATAEPSLAYSDSVPSAVDLAGLARRRGQRLLATAADVAREAAPEVPVTAVVRAEQPGAALLDEAARASLLVLGTPPVRFLGRAVAGSVTTALAARAACPVAIVRPHVAEDEPPGAGPVVVGVDASPGGDEAIAAAFDEACHRGAALVAVHVWDEAFLCSLFEETRRVLDRPAIEAHERELLAQRLAGWREKYPDVAVERMVARGRAADRLLDHAEYAQLIVVGSHGRGGFAGLPLGSTSQALITFASCPLLIARHD
ncbi:universal stress protein [Amycolatopsis thermoflava]|uniref:universal stress protein n=1 Tax=Amycolatopsis thermoflava TaxID=84480 RepID=UPI003648D72E